MVYNNITRSFGDPAAYVTPPYSSAGICLSSFGWQLPTCGDTPSAKMYPCLGDQTDQRWLVHSNNGSISNECGLCLGTRAVPQSPDTSVQLWIKPQLPFEIFDDGNDGEENYARVAAFLINNSPQSFNATIEFASHLNLGRPKNYTGFLFTNTTISRVRDVWMRREIHKRIQGSFSCEVLPFDSNFFIFEALQT